MAGEAIRDTSAWEEILAGASVGAGAISGESGSINAATTITANQKLYELVEFKLEVTGTPAADNNTVDLLRRAKSDGAAGEPTVSYAHDYVGSFKLKSAANQPAYIYGIPLDDDLDTYYLVNRDTGALTLALKARTRTTKPAA